MTRRSEVGDNRTYMADSDTGFDAEGYVLTAGTDSGDRQVRKASGADSFVGVNHRSSYNHDDTEVLTGQPVAVEQDGVVNVQCVDGNAYSLGDEVYVSGTAGVADPSTNTNDLVGKVAEDVDTTAGDGTGTALVPVNITGRC
jgi:hypothetical protein